MSTLLKEDKQSIIDYVVPRLLEQGPAIRFGTSRCMYRTDDGKKCAVGMLIPDDQFDPDMDDTMTSDEVIDRVFEMHNWSSTNDALKAFVLDLQRCHDMAAKDQAEIDVPWMEGFKAQVGVLCKEYEVTYPA